MNYNNVCSTNIPRTDPPGCNPRSLLSYDRTPPRTEAPLPLGQNPPLEKTSPSFGKHQNMHLMRLQRCKRIYRSVERTIILTVWPLSRQCEIPWQFSAWSETKMKCISSANSRMDANMQLTTNSFICQFSPTRLFSWLLMFRVVKNCQVN